MKSIENLRNELDKRCKSGYVPLSQTRDLWNLIDGIEAELNEGWVELPRDSEGIPIRPNDEIVVHYPEEEPEAGTVTALILTDRWDFEQSCWDTDSRDVSDLRGFYENVRHVKPDTWEQIIKNAIELGYTDPDNEHLEQVLVDRCKALAGEGKWACP